MWPLGIIYGAGVVLYECLTGVPAFRRESEAETLRARDFLVEHGLVTFAEGEDRFVLLGLSMELKLLVVCHCYRSAADAIRIISARKATAAESRTY